MINKLPICTIRWSEWVLKLIYITSTKTQKLEYQNNKVVRFQHKSMDAFGFLTSFIKFKYKYFIIPSSDKKSTDSILFYVRTLLYLCWNMLILLDDRTPRFISQPLVTD